MAYNFHYYEIYKYDKNSAYDPKQTEEKYTSLGKIRLFQPRQSSNF